MNSQFRRKNNEKSLVFELRMAIWGKTIVNGSRIWNAFLEQKEELENYLRQLKAGQFSAIKSHQFFCWFVVSSVGFLLKITFNISIRRSSPRVE